MVYMRKLIIAAIAVGFLLLPSYRVMATDWSGDGDVPAFYRWKDPLPHRPGVMLRTQDMPDALSLPDAGSAEQILYTSTDWRNSEHIITVSGAIFFPKGKPPEGGWPLIGWAHGTTGIADVCAPSLQPRSNRDKAYLGAWLRKGFAIVATDYQGLGTPGVHPYLQFRAEGYSVLDSLRAAIAHYRALSPRQLLTMGQSQGGEGSIAAAYLAPVYSPELGILGTVATGVVAHTANIGDARQTPLSPLYTSEESGESGAYEALWFLGTAQSIDPDRIRPADYLSENGLKLAQKAQRSCMKELSEFASRHDLGYSKFYRRPSPQLEETVNRWTDFPDVHIPTPVFVGTGLSDNAALPEKQYNFASAMCAAGTRVEMHYYPGADHSGAVLQSLEHSVPFVDRLIQGRPVTGNCKTIAPPPPR